MLKGKLFEVVLFFYVIDVLNMILFFSITNSGKFCVMGEDEGKETIHAFQKPIQTFSGGFQPPKNEPIKLFEKYNTWHSQWWPHHCLMGQQTAGTTKH